VDADETAPTGGVMPATRQQQLTQAAAAAFFESTLRRSGVADVEPGGPLRGS
jgi:hypothetical protein